MLQAMQSAELRWFFTGLTPVSVVDWFFNGHSPPHETQYIADEYILMHGENTGVKVRRSKLEIKSLTDTPYKTFIGGHITGLLQTWQKLILDLPGSDQSYGTKTIKVNKTRFVRTISFDGEPHEAPPGLRFTNQCNIELTQLFLLSEKWWTIGLESTGNSPAKILESNLLKAAEMFFHDEPPCELTTQNSFSYPTLLQKQVKIDENIPISSPQ